MSRRPLWPVAAFLLVAVVLVLTVWQSAERLTPGEAGLGPRPTMTHGDGVLGPWLIWDAGVYETIADHGYEPSDVDTFDAGGEARVAFFPGYPRLVGAVSTLTGDTATSLMVVTFAAGLGLALVLHRWFLERVGAEAARWALWSVLLFPWGYFLVATGYGDALFLLCAVGAFRLLEHDRPVAAGVLGAVATVTRPVGVALVIGLVVRAAERRCALSVDGWRPRLDVRRLRRCDVGVLLAASGLLGYMAFCWVRYGDPVAFSTAQRGWNQANGPRTWFKLELIDLVLHSTDTFFVLRLVLHGAVLLVFCAAIPAVWRRFGAGYGAYTAVALLMPAVGSAAFASQGRYVLAAFPVFALLGERLSTADRRRAGAYLGGSAVALLVVASFWGRGYWMG